MNLVERINALYKMNWEGWLIPESMNNLVQVLLQQQKDQIVGDMLEIGVFRGKFAVLLAAALQPTEYLYLVDLFAPLPPGQNMGSINNERDLLHWKQYPAFSEEQLLAKLKTVFDTVVMDHIHTVKCDSMAMPLQGSFRIIHVDGNHALETARHDIAYAFDHIMVGGTVIVDDWHHSGWPEVGKALIEALRGRSNIMVVNTDSAKCYLRRQR